jgi:hypothetical protein
METEDMAHVETPLNPSTVGRKKVKRHKREW